MNPINSTSIIIDNVVVTKNDGNIIQLIPVKLLNRRNINIDNVPHKIYDSRIVANRILSGLASGIISYNEL